MTQVRGGVEPAEKPVPPPAVDPSKANVQQFLEQLAVDIATRRDEIRLRRREIEVGLAYAEQAVAAQERDLHSTRCEQRRGRRDRYLFLILTLLIVVAFFTVVLKIGKDACDAVERVAPCEGDAPGRSSSRNDASQRVADGAAWRHVPEHPP